MFDLTGKRIVITGASSGLGRHFAGLLHGAGAHLGLLARRLDRLQDVKEELAADSDGSIVMTIEILLQVPYVGDHTKSSKMENWQVFDLK